MAAYLDYHHEYRNGKTPDEIDLFYNALSRVLQGATKDYFQARYIIKSLKNKNLDLYNHYFSTFIAENKNPTFAQAVQMVHQHNVRFMNGALAPEIDAHRDNGSDLQLSDFRGKVLYVSFWASWCKPCIENMINTKSLKESLVKKGVVFVNVSMDRDDATWRSSLQNYRLWASMPSATTSPPPTPITDLPLCLLILSLTAMALFKTAATVVWKMPRIRF
ncbi:MAG: TlpA family protein disulfide reductase [Sphingobacteriales bacterium]|nr:TlpA family protein disulfide reductase [Sphingobacteriales bacterium]